MIRPPSPRSRKYRAAARAQVNVPRRCTWTTVSKSSSDMFHSTLSRSTPALVTMASSRPKLVTARSTRACAASLLPTPTTSATARPPAAVIACTVACAASALTSLTTTPAPAAASARA